MGTCIFPVLVTIAREYSYPPDVVKGIFIFPGKEAIVIFTVYFMHNGQMLLGLESLFQSRVRLLL